MCYLVLICLFTHSVISNLQLLPKVSCVISWKSHSLQVIRFGHDWDPTCMKMDEVLYSIAEKVKNYAVFYLVDITEVPDFNKM